jgi:hypothetical protein
MIASADIRTVPSTAILVINSRSGPMLCPFFAKCDGVLMVDPTRKTEEFHRHDQSDEKSLCDLILALKPGALVCGFIGEAEKERLRAAGIDVRLGSCSCPVGELFAGFHSLPRA